jgi:death-on-curing protein
MAAMAAAYLFHIAQNHSFHDGNKRAAVMSALVFLDANGIDRLPDTDELEATTLAVASGEMGKNELTPWLRSHISVG